MSKREKRLYIFLAAFFALYVVIEQYKPEPLIWVPSFAEGDKQPYGGYVLYERLDDFFPSKQLSFETIYEHSDTIEANMIVLTTSFDPANEDVDALKNLVGKGNDVLIGANYFSEAFLDSLGLQLDQEFELETFNPEDSLPIYFDDQTVYYGTSMVVSMFDLQGKSDWEVIARSEGPVMIYRSYGKGRLVLTTHPLAFTNYGILKSQGLVFPERALNLLGNDHLIYNRYYHSGRLESQSPLRYLISQPPLRWGLNLTLIGILILLVFGSRRKQREIPLKDPKTNTTLQFIKTMGGLYHQEGQHSSAALKLISHFLIGIKEKYYIRQMFEEATYQSLAAKTGLPKSEVIKTFEMIQHVRNGGMVSERMLKEINERIEKFNIK